MPSSRYANANVTTVGANSLFIGSLHLCLPFYPRAVTLVIRFVSRTVPVDVLVAPLARKLVAYDLRHRSRTRSPLYSTLRTIGRNNESVKFITRQKCQVKKMGAHTYDAAGFSNCRKSP